MTRARITIVLGKGGVGRTTIAAALALAWARAGERVLLTSVSDPAELERRVASEGGEAPPESLTVSALEPRALVDALVRRVLPVGPLADYVVRHPGYESFVGIVPGIRELAILNEVFEKRDSGFDRIVLDGPATGHGLHFLEAPRRSEGLLVGRLKERVEAIDAFLQDPRRTDLVLVTLPEETPVRETGELARALRAQGFSVDNVVVNRWLPDVFGNAGARTVLDALVKDRGARESLARAVARDTRIDVEDWLAAADLVRSQRDEHREHLADLERLGAKLALVPWLPSTQARLPKVAEALAPGGARP